MHGTQHTSLVKEMTRIANEQAVNAEKINFL